MSFFLSIFAVVISLGALLLWYHDYDNFDRLRYPRSDALEGKALSDDQKLLVEAIVFKNLIIGGVFAAGIAAAVGWVAGTAVPFEKEVEIREAISGAKDDIDKAVSRADDAIKRTNASADAANKVKAKVDSFISTKLDSFLIGGWPPIIVCEHDNLERASVYKLLHADKRGETGTTTYAIVPAIDSTKARLIFFDASNGKLSDFAPKGDRKDLRGCGLRDDIDGIIKDGRAYGFLQLNRNEINR